MLQGVRKAIFAVCFLFKFSNNWPEPKKLIVNFMYVFVTTFGGDKNQ